MFLSVIKFLSQLKVPRSLTCPTAPRKMIESFNIIKRSILEDINFANIIQILIRSCDTTRCVRLCVWGVGDWCVLM